jgi:hypothetical protein
MNYKITIANSKDNIEITSDVVARIPKKAKETAEKMNLVTFPTSHEMLSWYWGCGNSRLIKRIFSQ